MKLPPEERKQIENEMLFRRLNEKVGQDLDDLDAKHIAEGDPHLVRDDDIKIHFKCECSDENCQIRVPMKLSEYKKFHEDRSSFIIKPRHEVKPIEKVIKVTEAYSIVRKNNTTPEPKKDAKFNKTNLTNTQR